MIIPLYTPNFDLETLKRDLPQRLGRKVASYQALELPHRYFRYAINEPIDDYLLPKEVQVVTSPVEVQREVARFREAAAESPPVTADRLNAQDRFEPHGDYQSGDVDGAITAYDDAIALDPTDPRSFNGRGLARQDQGDLDGAIADYGEAIRLDPTLALAVYGGLLASTREVISQRPSRTTTRRSGYSLMTRTCTSSEGSPESQR